MRQWIRSAQIVEVNMRLLSFSSWGVVQSISQSLITDHLYSYECSQLNYFTECAISGHICTALQFLELGGNGAVLSGSLPRGDSVLSDPIPINPPTGLPFSTGNESIVHVSQPGYTILIISSKIEIQCMYRLLLLFMHTHIIIVCGTI